MKKLLRPIAFFEVTERFTQFLAFMRPDLSKFAFSAARHKKLFLYY